MCYTVPVYVIDPKERERGGRRETLDLLYSYEVRMPLSIGKTTMAMLGGWLMLRALYILQKLGAAVSGKRAQFLSYNTVLWEFKSTDQDTLHSL